MGVSTREQATDELATSSASDIVLTDDNFASILNAIEEGRRMFDNIKKFVLHLLAGEWPSLTFPSQLQNADSDLYKGNVMQALVLLVGLSFKDVNDLSVFPLTPIEILYVIM